METLERVKNFLSVDFGDGSGYGDGRGSGGGGGDGSGDGNGYGSGNGYGIGGGRGYGSGYGGRGYGSGYGGGGGDGYGNGYGNGNGSGYGNGDGSGRGSGSGDCIGDGSGYSIGYGIKLYCGDAVHSIDNVATIIDHIHGNYARGRILREDLTTISCYLVKSNNIFAHGETLRDAQEALNSKLLEDTPVEDRIRLFVEAHDLGTEYPNMDLFYWHNKLTGSCEMGRREFARDCGIDLDGTMTVERFIDLTKDAYEGHVIRALAEAYADGGIP